MIKFSILTPSYNSGRTIERTLKSVLDLTYANVEYIVVDGASKDNTCDVIKRYEPMFKGRMRWISEPDSGIYDAMNKGVRMATGDIIGIVNSDDWLEPDALDKVMEVVVANDNDENTIYCGGINFHRIDGSIKRWDANVRVFKAQAPLYVMSGIRHPATFVPRQVYEKIGLFNSQMKLSADQDFILRCYYGAVVFIEVPEILSNMSEGGVSTGGSDRARVQSRMDRKIMLKGFGKKGMSYVWLYYSWYIRGVLRRCLKKIGLYR